MDTKFSYHKYDAKGNPLEVSTENGMHVVYLWGNNKTKAIAKIENATFSEVASALGISEATLMNYNENNIYLIDNLRNNVNMQKAMITTYSYMQVLGLLTQKTDPKGYKEMYFYDSNERLKYITDDEAPIGNILMQYDYHYKQ